MNPQPGAARPPVPPCLAGIRGQAAAGYTDVILMSGIGDMIDRKPIECWLTDMDGVLVHDLGESG